jgi:hypothetical protein
MSDSKDQRHLFKFNCYLTVDIVLNFSVGRANTISLQTNICMMEELILLC